MKKMLKIALFICLTAVILTVCSGGGITTIGGRGDTKNYVLIVAGQSNAVGLASNPIANSNVANYTFTRVRIWKNGAWEILNPADNTQSYNQAVNNHGIEPYIGYYFEKYFPNDNLYIIKYAVGGISLAVDGNYNDWSQVSNGEAYYVLVNNYLISAFASSQLSSYEPLRLWWMQGESDTLNEAFAGAYFDNLGDFFSHLVTDVPEVEGFTKFIGRVRENDAWPYRGIVRQGQAAFCAIFAYKAVLIDTYYVDVLPDNVHYSAEGFAELGPTVFFLMSGVNGSKSCLSRGDGS